MWSGSGFVRGLSDGGPAPDLNLPAADDRGARRRRMGIDAVPPSNHLDSHVLLPSARADRRPGQGGVALVETPACGPKEPKDVSSDVKGA